MGKILDSMNLHEDDAIADGLADLKFETDPEEISRNRLAQKIKRTSDRRYGAIAMDWLKLGYAVIPGGKGEDGKAPMVLFSSYLGGPALVPDERVDIATISDWADKWPDCRRGLLLLDSNPARRLVVIDVDDTQWLDWVIQNYGDTPLRVSTGREGGGIHLYYRAPDGEYVTSRNKHIGPDEAFVWDPATKKDWISSIDVKSSGAYVVTPGSIHASGLEYKASVEITEALLDTLPTFNLDLYEKQCAATKIIRQQKKGLFDSGVTTTAAGVGHSSVSASRETMPDSTVVRLASGQETTIGQAAACARLGQWVKCYCPFHGNTETPAAGIRIGPSGRPYLKCFGSCDTIWTVEAPSAHQNIVPHLEPEQGIQKDVRTERYLAPFDLTSRVTYIRSMRDSGKTTQMVAKIEEYHDSFPLMPITVILCRQALVSGYVEKLRYLGFVDYRDKAASREKLVVTCLDSIEKLKMLDVSENVGEFIPLARGITFIDESEQVIRHIAGETIQKNSTPERVILSLGELARNTRHLIWADADLSELTMRLSRRLLRQAVDSPNVEEKLIDNLAPTGRSALLYPSIGHLELARRGWWLAGEKLAIFSTTKAEAQRIASDLRAERPTAKVIEIHGATSQRPDIKDMLKDPDTWIQREKPDALVYSPSMGAGVDVSIMNYWDRVLAYVGVGSWTTLWDVMQGLERIRNPKIAERAVWAEEKSIWAQTNPAIVRGQVLQRALGDKDLSVIDAPAAVPGGDTGSIRIPVNVATLDTIVDITIKRAQGQGHLLRDLIREMHRLHWKVSWLAHDYGDDEKDEKARTRQIKKIQKEQEVDAIINAACMDVDRAYEIIRTHEQVDDDVMLSACRTVIEDICGAGGVEKQDVKEWLAGRLRKTISNFGIVRAIHEKDLKIREAVGTRQIDRWLKSVSTHPARYRGEVFAYTLKVVYGVNLGSHPDANPLKGCPNWVATCSSPVPKPTSGQLLTLKKLLPLLNVLGIWSSAGVAEQPFEILGRIAREMGFSGTPKRNNTKLAGKVIHKPAEHYQVNQASMDRMYRLADRWVERVLDQHEKRIDPDGYRVRRLSLVEDPAAEEIIRWYGCDNEQS